MRSVIWMLLSVPALLVAWWASSAVADQAALRDGSSRPQTIIIGVDLSESNPLTRDRDFALRVAQRVQPVISGLAPRSKVILRSFGSYEGGSNVALTLDVSIAPKTARAEDMARVVAGAIAGVPELVRTGKVRPQAMTNIVPFLMNMSRVVNCQAMPTYVILATDGVEDSQVANLKRRNAHLPVPAVPPFPGCAELQILGIGRGLNSPRDTERLIDEWGNWSKAAGFRNFTALNDW
jgi:hypothetical protein